MEPDVPTGPNTGNNDIPENDGEVVEPEEDTNIPEEKVTQIEYFKNFLLNYTDFVVQYIESNKLYFSHNLCDFYIEFGDSEISLYKRRYDSYGDYDNRKTYTTQNLESLLNEILNDVNVLEFLNRI